MAGHDELRCHAGPASRAGRLLTRGYGLLTDAAWEGDPPERFRTAYLAALRGAGAVLAHTGADTAPRARSRNAWVLLARATPEFLMWSDYFAAASPLRAALEAGLPRRVTAVQADELCARVGAFLDDVADLLAGGARTHPVPGRDHDMTA